MSHDASDSRFIKGSRENKIDDDFHREKVVGRKDIPGKKKAVAGKMKAPKK